MAGWISYHLYLEGGVIRAVRVKALAIEALSRAFPGTHRPILHRPIRESKAEKGDSVSLAISGMSKEASEPEVRLQEVCV